MANLMITIWIFLWNLFHYQDKRIPVKVVIADSLHKKTKIGYYQVRSHKHARPKETS